MHQLNTKGELLMEAVDPRFDDLSERADMTLSRQLRKVRSETSTEQPKHKPSLHRKRTRRHVQMIKIESPRADEFRKDDPQELLLLGLATKTSRTGGDQAFRPIKKKRDRFERNAIRELKQQTESNKD